MSKKKKISQPKSIPTAITQKPLDENRFCWQALLGGLLLLPAVLTTITAGKVVALISCIAAVFLLFLKSSGQTLQNRLSAPVWAVLGYCLMCGISTFYARSGKFAIDEFSKLLFALFIYLFILLQVKGTLRGVRGTALALAGTSAAISFLSIDAASCGLLKNVLAGIWPAYGYIDIGFEAGTRMTGIFGNANILAGILAFGILLSLYLVLSSETVHQRMVSIFILAVNSMGFLLAFSMGATGIFVLAIIAYLIFAGQDRIPALVLMVETAVSTVLFTFISFVGMGKDGVIAWIAILAVFCNAALLYCLHHFVGDRFSRILLQKTKLAVGFGATVVVLIAAYVGLGLVLTGPYSLQQNEQLCRAAYPESGNYTLQTESDAPVTVTVESQNMMEVMMHTSTVIFKGDAASASFTVPEESKVVYFNFSGNGGTTISQAFLKGDGGTTQLKLNYRLFPGFIANRLQGLWANQNAIQRTVFFNDGLKLFGESPLIGLGLGSFENGIASVQEFYYETKYAHNHYIQCLLETGIIGLLLFLSMLFFSAWSLWKNRKNSPYGKILPALAGCLVMMIGHSSVEVIFSISFYLPFAFAILALIALCFGDPKIPGKKTALGTRIVSIALPAVFAVLLSGNLIATSIKNGDYDLDTIFPAMEQAMKLDVFDRNDYLLSYVLNAPYSPDTEIQAQSEIYAEQLSHVKSNSISTNLVQYYFSMNKPEKAFQISRQGIEYIKSNPEAWQTQFALYESFLDSQLSAESPNAYLAEHGRDFFAGVQDMYDYLLEVNAGRMEKITLSPQNNAFLCKISLMKALSANEVPAMISVWNNQIFDSTAAPDADQNGIPDGLTGISAANGSGWKAASHAVIQLPFCHRNAGTYQLVITCDHPEAITAALGDAALSSAIGENFVSFAMNLETNDKLTSQLIKLKASQDISISSIVLGK